jgi:hypothetical protein
VRKALAFSQEYLIEYLQTDSSAKPRLGLSGRTQGSWPKRGPRIARSEILQEVEGVVTAFATRPGDNATIPKNS